MRTSRCALDIKGAKQWKLEVQNTQKKNITRAHPYFTLLHVYWRPRVFYCINNQEPPAATPPTHCSMNRKAWRRMKKAHSVLHCSSSSNPHGQDFFHFHLDVCQSRGFLHGWRHYIAQMRSVRVYYGYSYKWYVYTKHRDKHLRQYCCRSGWMIRSKKHLEITLKDIYMIYD